ncbi:alpha-N-acetylgalactosaminide alpha-2,6-sialyltransferase 1 [Petaurus breviceps papuanus]|uniref:alpha-N-acetylgalactosaminide alpha-2,6-sialyltransferase 1 n=1 Tax=Petaurus breviceps papuanus TaxID=3040969 RepID=UPI0036DF4C19
MAVFLLFSLSSFIREPKYHPSSKSAQTMRPAASFQNPTPTSEKKLEEGDFQAEPHWDFEDEYRLEVGSPRTNCPDSVKVKAAQSYWLRERFLPNLTLFLDVEHFNLSEWNRLEHFKPPFGFMGLNYSMVRGVLEKFPPVSQQQLLLAARPQTGSLQCISCAVVGNGGILKKSQMGKQIDSHDYVFRVNGALINGYEKDVGTRTSFYGFTMYSLIMSLHFLRNQGFHQMPRGKDIHYLHFLEGKRDFEFLEKMLRDQTVAKAIMEKSLRHYKYQPFSLDSYLLIHPDLLRYVKNRFLRSNILDTIYWPLYRPSNGAFLLLTAIQLCDQVSAYGFITNDFHRFADHYYDPKWKKMKFYSNHDFILEKRLWKQLHNEGIIWLYQGPKAITSHN